ncbi:uracil-DNA glycosylase [Pseudorhodoplanes sinuspersici]|uniref:Type-4 uracil-DNA glycosylase n=1 Tax=Pseudorhodoplanes sinuspersici TaxID=1235591 RepID=A0A1W6ZQ90_9HYPH|nr:uracil-DNA glycosylase [Pseudorhodoplanes sinuspersici]ARP99578.1 uracil-DNA glycosylase [Pseudorhodoplanes sinuspersici]RKE70549.1 DNA polymerase [Pseudorhodoplanes sinuspersici]
MTPGHEKAARDLLTFYVEAGVDAVLGEEPVDRFADIDMAPAAEPAAPKPAPLAPVREMRAAPSMPAVQVPPPPEEAIMAARAAAKSVASLEELRAIMNAFEGCALRTTAKQLVFGDGSPQARLMFIGEAPGSEEDQKGIPFVGRSGQLLDRMLTAIGIARQDVYIANIVPWRPPGNRDPSIHESQTCLPFIQRQIELVDPDVIVCLGKPSTATLLGVTDGIRRTRGRWFKYDTGKREIRATATFHPAYLLRTPIEKRFAWRDFLAIKKALGN